MIYEKIKEANLTAAKTVAESLPYWVDVAEAIECVDGLDDYTVLHSGPPIEFENMCSLHKRGVINAALFEGWAKTEEEAEKLAMSGKIKVDSAMNYNTDGSGVGIITKSVPMLVVEDKNTKKRAGLFFAEGKFGGGFCGWGVYSKEIKENIEYMKNNLFAEIKEVLKEKGGLSLKPILIESLKMGDENHSRQTAADLLFIRDILPLAFKCKNAKELMSYFAQTGRFFHNFGQAASRSATLGAENTEFSSMVVAAGGNGVEYGIKVAGLPGKWFTAPSPMIEGRYMAEGAKRENQLPWIGDSSIVECAGLGGILSAASPEVCSWRGDSLADAIKTTREMEKICITRNESYSIPNLDFDHPPVGIDILKAEESGILPVIDGGMIDKNGGWMGAGCAKIPYECFKKAAECFKQTYFSK